MSRDDALSRSTMLLTSNSRGFSCPQRYIQGVGEFNNVFRYGKKFGNHFIFIVDAEIEQIVVGMIERIEDKCGCDYCVVSSSAETCLEEVNRLAKCIRASGCNIVAGVGGGKVLDTAKLASDKTDLPRIIIPTSASTDAPAADWAALYTPEGVHITGKGTTRSTELVLVDTQVIANAPSRLFSAGIGDALATWFEAEAVRKSYTPNCVGEGYRGTIASAAVCKACYDVLMDDAVMALEAVEIHAVTEAVENVVEANILMSGLGFINGGLAASHGLHAGFSEVKGTEKILHGEKVAFGLLCQLVLEKCNKEEFYRILEFMYKTKLPITMGQIGIELNEDNLNTIAGHTLNKNMLIHHEPLAISAEQIKSAIRTADFYGRKYLSSKNA